MARRIRAIRTTVHGITFHSKGEATRYCELLYLQKAGSIRYLQHQTRFDLTVNNDLICRYYADFTYEALNRVTGTWSPVVEDFKGKWYGAKTAEYRLKKKLMRALHGIEILET